jgi:hypothetical protein
MPDGAIAKKPTNATITVAKNLDRAMDEGKVEFGRVSIFIIGAFSFVIGNECKFRDLGSLASVRSSVKNHFVSKLTAMVNLFSASHPA